MEEQTSDIKKLKGKKKSQRFYALLAFVVFIAVIGVVSVLINHQHQNKPQRVAVVQVTQEGFQPSTLVVKKGTKVTWINNDTKLHQIKANPYPTGKDLPQLKSQILNNTQTYTYIADQTGSFGYHDQMQPTINGTIVIRK